MWLEITLNHCFRCNFIGLVWHHDVLSFECHWLDSFMFIFLRSPTVSYWVNDIQSVLMPLINPLQAQSKLQWNNLWTNNYIVFIIFLVFGNFTYDVYLIKWHTSLHIFYILDLCSWGAMVLEYHVYLPSASNTWQELRFLTNLKIRSHSFDGLSESHHTADQ